MPQRSRLCGACSGTLQHHSGRCSEMTRDQRNADWRYWSREVERLDRELADAKRERDAAAAHLDALAAKESF